MSSSAVESQSHSHLPADTLMFLRAWISAPLRVASAIPSSDSLADLMTRETGRDDGPVLELGPGTGVFSRALMRQGVEEENLTLVELGPEFADLLARRHPQAVILRMDACHLLSLDLRQHGAAVSGLPLLSMNRAKVTDILRGVFRCLRPGAALFQFTYGFRCPIHRTILDRLGLRARAVGFTVRNFPPATVYKVVQAGAG